MASAYILEKNQGQCLEWEGGGESSNIFFFFNGRDMRYLNVYGKDVVAGGVAGFLSRGEKV